MKVIICDNCGKPGQENYSGNLCEDCLKSWRFEHEVVEQKKSALEEELKSKYHIRYSVPHDVKL